MSVFTTKNTRSTYSLNPGSQNWGLCIYCVPEIKMIHILSQLGSTKDDMHPGKKHTQVIKESLRLD